MHNLPAEQVVGIDDACAFMPWFRNGSLTTFESTRYARGHKALYTPRDQRRTCVGRVDLHDLHRLQWFDHRDEGRTRGGAAFTSPTAIIPT